MSRFRAVSFIAFGLWEFVCLHGLSFWTMRRQNGQLKVVFSKHGFLISLLLSAVIVFCISYTFMDKIDYLTDDGLMAVDRVSQLVGIFVLFVTAPVVFISVWIHHKTLKEVGEKYLQIRGIMTAIGTGFDENYVQRAICRRIAPVVVAYLGLYGVMIYVFKTATNGGDVPIDFIWDYCVYWIAKLSPIYLIFLSIVKITITLCVAATRFQGIAKVLEVL